MEHIELVVRLPKGTYDVLQSTGVDWIGAEHILDAVSKGTPLPKGHGDLIDVNRKITVPIYDEQYEEWGEKTLTVREALNRWSDEGVTVKDVIIEADKAERTHGRSKSEENEVEN